MREDLAIVVIGRNEGERLRRCLTSLAGKVHRIVYVDSGSTDGSPGYASSLGAMVVELSSTSPFTAARARNAGVDALKNTGLSPFIMFVDGDCEIVDGWIETALQFLRDHLEVAAVCGRRREEFPEASVFNRLCDREWDTPIGETRSCGGDAIMRTKAFEQVGGYRSEMIAGEEPELCARLRRKGWKIWRIDREMTRHDAAIHTVRQWAKRARRSGYAAADEMMLQGQYPELLGVRTVVRCIVWSAILPLVGLGSLLVSSWFLPIVLCYPAQVMRLALKLGGTRKDWEEAFFLTLGKFPQALGVLEFVLGRVTSNRRTLIEYK